MKSPITIIIMVRVFTTNWYYQTMACAVDLNYLDFAFPNPFLCIVA